MIQSRNCLGPWRRHLLLGWSGLAGWFNAQEPRARQSAYTVRFELAEKHIHVMSDSDDLDFYVTVGLDGFGERQFYAGEQMLIDWHVRAKALKKLLFD